MKDADLHRQVQRVSAAMPRGRMWKLPLLLNAQLGNRFQTFLAKPIIRLRTIGSDRLLACLP